MLNRNKNYVDRTRQNSNITERNIETSTLRTRYD